MKTRRKKKAPEVEVNVSGEPPKPPKSEAEWKEAIVGKTPKPKHVDSDPMAPGRKLRTIREDFPHPASEGVTLILFTTLYEPRFATTARAKVELLDGVVEDPHGRLVAVWTGSKQSHAFAVTDEIAAEWLASLT